jgi:hypothetical protein
MRVPLTPTGPVVSPHWNPGLARCLRTPEFGAIEIGDGGESHGPGEVVTYGPWLVCQHPLTIPHAMHTAPSWDGVLASDG